MCKNVAAVNLTMLYNSGMGIHVGLVAMIPNPTDQFLTFNKILEIRFVKVSDFLILIKKLTCKLILFCFQFRGTIDLLYMAIARFDTQRVMLRS